MVNFVPNKVRVVDLCASNVLLVVVCCSKVREDAAYHTCSSIPACMPRKGLHALVGILKSSYVRIVAVVTCQNGYL